MSDPATTVDPATTSRQPFDEVPEAARGPAIDPARGYLVEEPRGGAYRVTDRDYQALLVTSKEGTVLVDAPPSLAPHLPAAVAQVSGAPVTRLVYSHSHHDHIGAAHLFGDATVIGHAEVARTLQLRNDPRRPVPTVTFQDPSPWRWAASSSCWSTVAPTTSPATSAGRAPASVS